MCVNSGYDGDDKALCMLPICCLYVCFCLRVVFKALESYTDLTLIEAIIMCLTRLQPMLRPVTHKHTLSSHQIRTPLEMIICDVYKCVAR